ncbi:hypothetical protein GCM10011380_03610 [Sphingomonas metalli]|uniref:TonB-dependent receptor n=2 Tax=Sphingomonas metalli TaxID=1779358 RepID=A0A916STK7_9SPHN|nr:hypothetical protein GCM10011380_03610 [Sphingomonas metalli]
MRSKFRHLASATALTGSLFLTVQAWAQTSETLPPAQSAGLTPTGQDPAAIGADGEPETDGVITVTGSRIPRPESDGILPGIQIDSAQIRARGFTNALDALNDNPLTGPGASFNGNNGGQTASLGRAFVDLLDLGTQRTLTLVNGRRFVSGNSASLFVEGNATGSQVDTNVIPTSLVQRIDVLTVGGAAAYGSDAIAGVVNYILRDDYEGSEVRALAGLSSRGDAGVQQTNIVWGKNFAGGRGNITLAAEYTHLDGLQADSRSFRLARPNTITNYASGGARNPNFSPNGTIVNVQANNNGAFLRTSDDLIPSTAFGQGFINQTLSFNGTILNVLGAPTRALYTPDANGFLLFANGIGQPSITNFTTGVQLVQGTPGSTLTGLGLSGNGLNGRTTAATNLPITTFAPTALPSGVTPAQVFAQFGVTPPAGVTGTPLTTLAINVLQANRPTAREFFAANPNVNINAFLGTFIPNLPRIANTDTTLVTVRSNANGGTVQVPLNQVLPYIAVPLEFTPDGQVRNYTAVSGFNPTSQGTLSQSPGSNGGFSRSIENIVVRVQQDRYVSNLIGKFDVTDEVTAFTENFFTRTKSVALRNSPSQNFITSTAENAALVLNVNNPYLDSSDRSALNGVGINSATRGGYFTLTRQNQDIFGDNPVTSTDETYRLLVGAKSKFEALGRQWNAEISAAYGRSTSVVRSTQINDIEYQLALDAVDEGQALRGVANGNIVCRAQLFPNQYIGYSPLGISANLTRQPGAGGLPTEVVVQPRITADQIAACRPLNPFGYNQMSEASKAYVRQNNVFRNVSQQTVLQAFFGGSPFRLPAGDLSFSINGEYRKEQLAYKTDLLNQLGRGRSAPSANTSGQTETYEVGAELLVPITGPDFLPFLGRLEFQPAVRTSQQSGRAATYRNLAGQIVEPRANGDANTIYSLAGTWAPIRDILVRGNYTRSVRNPSVVELFLGGQPSFTTPIDYCSPANIDLGLQATARRQNCVADVIRRGVVFNGQTITTSDVATQFLAQYVPLGQGLQGSFAGAPTLQPEKGKSWTVGTILTPRFIPGLELNFDYISLDLSNIISPTTLATAVQFCYDSSTFPNTAPQTGANTCDFFSRGTDFQIQNGFASGFINLSATQVRAMLIGARYGFDLPKDWGRLNFKATAYHLVRYTSSAAGDFTDAQESAGTYDRPQWRTQLITRYENGPFYTQLTWNWRDRTRLFSSGQPATIEVANLVVYPRLNTFDYVIGTDIGENFNIQFVVNNITDKNYIGDLGYYNSPNVGYYDQIGRRFQVAVQAKF